MSTSAREAGAEAPQPESSSASDGAVAAPNTDPPGDPTSPASEGSGADATTAETAPTAPSPGNGDGLGASDGAWSASTFSADDADKIAARFTASWEGTESANAWDTGPAPDNHPAVQAAAPPVARYDSVPPTLPVSKTNRWLMFGGLGGAALLVVILGSLAMAGSVDPEDVRPAEDTATPPQEQVPGAAEAQQAPEPAVVAEPEPAVEPEPAPPPEPPQVHVVVRTVPANATLLVDGARVGNPYDARLAQGGTLQAQASANGFQPASEQVEIDRDRTVVLRLRAVPRETPPVAAPSTMTTRQTRQTRQASSRMTSAMMRTSMRGAGFVTDNPY